MTGKGILQRLLVLGVSSLLFTGCTAGLKKQLKEERDHSALQTVQLEAKTQKLLQTSKRLHAMNQSLDEQRRRLTRICVDYPDHTVCAPQTAAEYARKAFCSDKNFTKHVDAIVKACHQGQCKQVEQAHELKRTQFMTLLKRLPHKLILFKAAKTRLDRRDKIALQHFVEQIGADHGYVIIVGRASRDGSWRANLRYALKRAENTRKYVVDRLGISQKQVGYITYGHPKMYLTELDAKRMTKRKRITVRQANRSAFVFTYPCFEANKRAASN